LDQTAPTSRSRCRRRRTPARVTADQPVTVGPSQNSGGLVQGGTASPTSANCDNTTENTVINQVYGTGTPKNVFV
jgi:hypothetical protein